MLQLSLCAPVAQSPMYVFSSRLGAIFHGAGDGDERRRRQQQQQQLSSRAGSRQEGADTKKTKTRDTQKWEVLVDLNLAWQ